MLRTGVSGISPEQQFPKLYFGGLKVNNWLKILDKLGNMSSSCNLDFNEVPLDVIFPEPKNLRVGNVFARNSNLGVKARYAQTLDSRPEIADQRSKHRARNRTTSGDAITPGKSS